MRKSSTPLTPDQVYRYAVQACQPYLNLRDTKKVAARTPRPMKRPRCVTTAGASPP